MRISRLFAALAATAGLALAAPALAQTVMKINISLAQNSH